MRIDSAAISPVPMTCLTVSALKHAAAIDYRDLLVFCRPFACICGNLICNNNDKVGELEHSVECHFSCTCYIYCVLMLGRPISCKLYLLNDWFVVFVISYLKALFGVASILSVLTVYFLLYIVLNSATCLFNT